MTRSIIAIYKTAVSIYVVVLLLLSLGLGIAGMIYGDSISERSFGLGIIVGGFFVTIVTAGSVALMIENNELLRIIAEKPSKVSETQVKIEPTIRREKI